MKKPWNDWEQAIEERDRLEARVAALESALRDIYEVYAGSEGFVPQYASEAYQQRIIKQMADIAGAALGSQSETKAESEPQGWCPFCGAAPRNPHNYDFPHPTSKTPVDQGWFCADCGTRNMYVNIACAKCGGQSVSQSKTKVVK